MKGKNLQKGSSFIKTCGFRLTPEGRLACTFCRLPNTFIHRGDLASEGVSTMVILVVSTELKDVIVGGMNKI